MPIVQPSNTRQLKLNLPASIVDELQAYSEQVDAPRSRVVRIALERLFDDDEDWNRETFTLED